MVNFNLALVMWCDYKELTYKQMQETVSICGIIFQGMSAIDVVYFQLVIKYLVLGAVVDL